MKDIVRVENGFEVLSCQKLRLELVKTVVVRVLLAELLALDGLKHFEDGCFGVCRLFV